tara:strand:+ start:12752 stop:12937 length:186 start_codon:yes stop_codon:yes gene_type:complete
MSDASTLETWSKEELRQWAYKLEDRIRRYDKFIAIYDEAVSWKNPAMGMIAEARKDLEKNK